jgi:hypothetical protein
MGSISATSADKRAAAVDPIAIRLRNYEAAGVLVERRDDSRGRDPALQPGGRA